MVFSSVVFIWCFLPIVLLLYYAIGKKFKNAFLLLASLFFYAWGEPRFVFVMMLSILLNWAGALIIGRPSRGKEKLLFCLLVLLNVLLLFVYKYLNFVIRNIRLLFPGSPIPQTSIALPIGISFFTFQGLSYVTDVYRGRVKAQKNIIHVALYIALFPQLIAGPIVRYQKIEQEIEHRTVTAEDAAEGISRFIVGLGKKVLLANTLAILADHFFGLEMEELSMAGAWTGALSYTLQIYFDFSGYSDMAIGLGRMFGFHLEENFDYPYRSRSVTDFWKRWHISLSSWFRDYVYIPLGGSRKGKLNTYRNLLAVWFLTGLWHGANWTFIAWGLWYLLILLLEKEGQRGLSKIPGWIRWTGTALVVVIGWVLFRSDSITQAFQYLGRMLLPSGEIGESLFLVKKYALFLGMSFIASLPVKTWLEFLLLQRKNGTAVLGILRMAFLTAIAVLSMACVISSTYNPFIYFNF